MMGMMGGGSCCSLSRGLGRCDLAFRAIGNKVKGGVREILGKEGLVTVSCQFLKIENLAVCPMVLTWGTRRRRE